MTNRSNVLLAFGCVLVLLRCALWYSEASKSAPCLESRDHEVSLTVAGVKNSGPGVLLDARIVETAGAHCPLLEGARVRLSWQRPAVGLEAGMLLQAQVKLRQPWGARNPGGFDYGLWLLGQGYVASGYVKAVRSVWPSAGHRGLRIADRYVHADLLNAIILGRRDAVSAEQWALFRETGTIHLMVVSGLHTAIFAALVGVVAMGLARALPIRGCWWLPRLAALCCGAAGTFALVWQTGANAPVVRAALMLGCLAAATALLRHAAWWRCFALMLLLALALQPRVLLQQGFWLSYAAVASLLWWFAPRLPPLSWVRALVTCQGVLLVALTPWLGMTAGEVPSVSPLANLIVVPLMTLVTIPCGMAATMLPGGPVLGELAHGLMLAADGAMALVLEVLQRLRGLAPGFGYFSGAAAAMGICAAVIVSMPLPGKIRWLAALGWLPMLVSPAVDVPAGEFRVILLDVGQGSSAIIDTRRHRLVLDAGARFASGFDFGAAVVVPALRATGPDRLDLVLVSHGDNDHAGGVGALTRRYPGTRVLGLTDQCRDGEHWRWDGVSFQVITDASAGSANDRSCTLLVSNARRSAYFSGDIGANAERRLYERLPVSVDLLLAPHHGSASSSTPAFVNRLRPYLVVFSAGRGNPYGHPREEVVVRYRSRGVHTLVTAQTGAITWYSDRPRGIATAR